MQGTCTSQYRVHGEHACNNGLADDNDPQCRQTRVEHERKSQKGWVSSWGFMAAQGKPKSDDSLNEFLTAVGNKHTFALSQRKQMQQLEKMQQTRQLQTQASQAGAIGESKGTDSVDSFMQSYSGSGGAASANRHAPRSRAQR